MHKCKCDTADNLLLKDRKRKMKIADEDCANKVLKVAKQKVKYLQSNL